MMKIASSFQKQRLLLISFLLAIVCGRAFAFPPAPHHVIYGLVRDELGTPLTSTNAIIILETLAGVQIRGPIIPQLEAGINYRLTVPMDSGLTDDAYKPTALRPTVGFRIRVVIGKNPPLLPIQMVGDAKSLGNVGETTRLDLTLGEDKDGDGIPDAWERLLLSLHPDWDLAQVNAAEDADNDGVGNYNEYIAGTYAFDPLDGFMLKAAGITNGAPLLDFMALRGRAYTLHGSTDLKSWRAIDFRIPAEGASGQVRQFYPSLDVRAIRIQPVVPSGAELLYFKLQVQ
jgi:hypothetical protein